MSKAFFSRITETMALILFIGAAASPQVPPDLQKQVDEAEARAKLSAARKSDLANRYSVTGTSEIKGGTEISGTPIEAKIQAYRAIDQITEKIANSVYNSGVRGVYIFDDDDFVRIVSYRALTQKLAMINGQYRKCLPTSAAYAAAIGPAASALLSWLPLFKTDTKINSFEIEVDESAVWASMGRNFARRGIRLGNPFASPFDFVQVAASDSALLDELNTASAYRAMTNCTGGSYKYKPQIDAAFDRLKNELGFTPIDPTPAKSIKSTATTDGLVSETTETWLGSEPAKVAANLIDYVITEQIIAKMRDERIYWIKVVSAETGGSSRIKGSPLIDIFRGGSSIKFSGGAIVTYHVLDNDGRLITSGNVDSYAPYRKSGDIVERRR